MDYFKPFFDDILEKFRDGTPERVKKALEEKDKELLLYLSSDSTMKARYKNVGIRERSVLTTIGLVTYKRHYFYDREDKEYIFPVDAIMQLPKRVKMSNELKVDIFHKYMSMNYTGIIREYSKYFDISKATISRVIYNIKLKSSNPIIKRKPGDIIHVQIDEKYVSVRKHKNKIRLYTATIFCGCSYYKKKIKRKRKFVRSLENVFIMSSFNINKLNNMINDYLTDAYGCFWFSDHIYLSGDFAPYIRRIAANLNVETIYVPDKWHVFKAFRDYLPYDKICEKDLQDIEIVKNIANKLLNVANQNAINLGKIIQKNPLIFKPYVDPEYLGCSQEGFNARIYAQKFSKKFSKFSKKTIEKIVLALECEVNHTSIEVINDIDPKLSNKNLFQKFDCEYNHFLKEEI